MTNHNRAEAEALFFQGIHCMQAGDDAATEEHYRRSIELNPSCAQTHLNLGALLANQERFIEVELSYGQAIVLAPDAPAGWSNLGVLYTGSKRE